VVDRLVERTGANPLALLELPGSLAPDQFAGRTPLEDVLPLTTRLERDLRRAGPAPTRAGAHHPAGRGGQTDGDPAVVLRAGARLGVGPDALDQAESAGLVGAGGGRLRFRHPLVRSAPTMRPPWRPGGTPTGPWPPSGATRT
jgi:hypothetical protein